MKRQAKMEVYEGDDGQFYWRLQAANGQVLAQGEGFTRRSSATRSAKRVLCTIYELMRDAE